VSALFTIICYGEFVGKIFIFLFIIILFFYPRGDGGSNKIVDLKKETFECSGKGGTGKIVTALFSIDPSSKTLTFTQYGGLMGSMLRYPKVISYNIKSSDGLKILTKDYTYSWTNRLGKTLNYISYIKTNDKKTFEYGFRQAKGNSYLFKDCNKIK